MGTAAHIPPDQMTISMQNCSPLQSAKNLGYINSGASRRPQTANVTSAMCNSIHKKFGYLPSEILRDTKIDTQSFVAEGTLKEEHAKLFQRVDMLIEAEKIAMEQARTTVYDASDIPDQYRREQELELLQKCEPVKGGVFKKIQPRVVNPLTE